MSYVNRFTSFLITEKGRKFSFYSTVAATNLVLFAHALPNTFFLEKYKEFLHLYRKGFTVALTDKLKERFEKALDFAKIESEDRWLYKPFACYGFDTLHAGTPYSKYGVIIGIPANFFYETTSDIDKELIRVNDASVVWDTDEGILLQKSLIIPEKAQLYAMVREIKFSETPKIFINTFASFASVAGCYTICNSINEKFNFYARPRSLRMVLYGLVASFCFGTWALCKDMSQCYYEMAIDKQIKNTSPILAEGGREYYGKLLQRNIALRKLLGKEGERKYSVNGNINYFIRQKHVPLVDRKRFFEEEIKLEDIQPTTPTEVVVV